MKWQMGLPWKWVIALCIYHWPSNTLSSTCHQFLSILFQFNSHLKWQMGWLWKLMWSQLIVVDIISSRPILCRTLSYLFLPILFHFDIHLKWLEINGLSAYERSIVPYMWSVMCNNDDAHSNTHYQHTVSVHMLHSIFFRHTAHL